MAGRFGTFRRGCALRRRRQQRRHGRSQALQGQADAGEAKEQGAQEGVHDGQCNAGLSGFALSQISPAFGKR